MPLRKAVQVDFTSSKLRSSTGAALSGAVVVAYDTFAQHSITKAKVIRRKAIWQDAMRTTAWSSYQAELDTEGYAPIFGDGTYDFRVYPDIGSVPAVSADPDVSESIAGAIDERLGYHYSDEIVNVTDYGAVADGVLGAHGDDPNDPDPNVVYGGTDNTRAFQAAIDYCLASEASPRRLFIPAGVYRIKATLRLARRNPILDPDLFPLPVGYRPASIEMFGEKRCVGYGADSIVYADFDNGPALAIQAGQGTRIKDLSFEGVNVWYENWPSFDVGGVNVTDDSYLLNDLFNESGITGGSCVDTAHAPYAGIAIDPFSLGQSGNYMPGGGTTDSDLDPYYVTPGEPSNHSTSISIEGCSFSRFIVGLVISPTGRDANAEDISVRDCAFTKNKIAIASGQSQARNFNVENITVFGAQFCFDTRTYGNGRGVAPNVRGANIGGTKYLFNIGTQGQTAWFEQIYCERCLGMGFVGAGFSSNEEGAHFVGCNFNFAQSFPAIDTHLFNYAHIHFQGCAFRVYRFDINVLPIPAKRKQRPPLSFTNFAPLTFTECVLATLDLQGTESDYFDSVGIALAGTIPMGFHDPSQVVFHRFKVADGTLSTPFSYLDSSYPDVEAPYLIGSTVPPGAIIHSQDTSGKVRIIGGGIQEILLKLLGTITVTNQGAGVGEALFNLGLNGVLRVGDVVYCDTGWLPEAYPDAPTYLANGSLGLPSKTKSIYTAKGVCGMVTDINTSVPAKATLSFIPESIYKTLPLGLVLYVKRFGRFHRPSTGTIAPGGPDITPVSDVSLWKSGDRIRARNASGVEQLVEGTYVVSVNPAMGGKITMSRSPATAATSGSARLYDADVLAFTGTPE